LKELKTERRYKVTVNTPQEYQHGIVLGFLNRFVKDSQKLQGVKVKIKDLPIHDDKHRVLGTT